jgi:hypothetical protein
LKDDDVRVTPSGVPGPDLMLSPRAREIYDFDFECKNQESLSIWAALHQLYERREQVLAKAHKKKAKDPEVIIPSHTDLPIPALVFSRNREKRTYVCLDLEDFLKLIR